MRGSKDRLRTGISRGYRLALLAAVSLAAALSALAMPGEVSTLAGQREHFLAAQTALARDDQEGFEKLLAKLEDYPLYGYLRYAYLQRHLESVSDADIGGFLNRYADLPVSARLRAAWLEHLAEQERWDTFLDAYRGERDTELRCHHLWARFLRGEAVLKEVEALWLVGYPQPKACDPIFAVWQKSGQVAEHLTGDLVWKRIRLAIDQGQWTLVEYLSRWLSPSDKRWLQRWQRMAQNPLRELQALEDPETLEMDEPLAREIVLYGLKRLARQDAGQAREAWLKLKDSERFTEEDIASIDREIALAAATQSHPQALEWLAALGADADRPVREWRVRCALEKQDWRAVLKWIETLVPEERNLDEWHYWRARALEALDRSAEARAIFGELAKNLGYYGFLAADRLGASHAVRSQPIAYAKEDLRALEDLPGLVRARELYLIDMRTEARAEWDQALREADANRLQAAAVLAHRWGWHDRAIAAAARGGYLEGLELRFPLAYREQVVSSAREWGLDPAWVYGVVRQESAFWVDARSSAGALGLMQLMPGTAQQMAGWLKIPHPSLVELLRPDTNIRLGSAYLRKVLDTYQGHRVLATAAYNAGPNRVKRWLPEQGAIPADLWVEGVPLAETRKYVKQVLAHTAVYRQRLGRPALSLSSHMADVVALD